MTVDFYANMYIYFLCLLLGIGSCTLTTQVGVYYYNYKSPLQLTNTKLFQSNVSAPNTLLYNAIFPVTFGISGPCLGNSYIELMYSGSCKDQQFTISIRGACDGCFCTEQRFTFTVRDVVGNSSQCLKAYPTTVPIANVTTISLMPNWWSPKSYPEQKLGFNDQIRADRENTYLSTRVQLGQDSDLRVEAPKDPSRWMEELDINKLSLMHIVWPGTHDSGTQGLLVAETQTLDIYEQLIFGVRMFDIRVGADGHIWHGIVPSLNRTIKDVCNDVNRFLTQHPNEFILMEIRQNNDKSPPEPDFSNYVINALEQWLITWDVQNIVNPISQLKGRLIVFWEHAAMYGRGKLWTRDFVRDDYQDLCYALDKLEQNRRVLDGRGPISNRNYFYRIEHTLTPSVRSFPIIEVRPLANRVNPFVKLWTSDMYRAGLVDDLQIISMDFVPSDLINVCYTLTKSRK